mmetsp:Transcript_67868/g.150333  ORF Transcript_67868/g.150333 Transcript_67868/m.150333 type:complete len:208 (+) Transcript_67868:2-625(+)
MARRHILEGSCGPRAALVAQIWGVGFWVALFGQSIFALSPRAVAPLQRQDLSPGQWFIYIVTCLALLVGEGMGAFQRGFSPLLVERSRCLGPSSPWHELVLSPFFVAGLFAGTPRRLLKSWLLMVILIPGLALTVSRLSYPWRESVDAGVVLGLSWGTGVVLVYSFRASVWGLWPETDPEFPALRGARAGTPWPEACNGAGTPLEVA